MTEQRLKIAVFIDFDNIEIGVKSTLGGQFDVGLVLEAIKERGEVVTKVAYGDWKRAGEHARALGQHAIRMVQRNLTPGGDKNGADINLALDALEMAFTHAHINAYVIVGGDSDFITLVEKLKQYDKMVFVVGGRAFTSIIMQKNCHEFIAYENLIAPRRSAERGRAPVGQVAAFAQAEPLVKRALKILADREVSPQLGLLKSTLLQLDSTFSERTYGASSFRDFAEKLAEAGVVKLKHSGRSMLVELDEPNGAAASQPAPAPVNGASGTEAAPTADEAHAQAGHNGHAAQEEAPATPSSPALVAEGLRMVDSAFQSAPSTLRWPMYVRNVKQYLRSVYPDFDERKYGFAGIIDLLRACQREGLLSLERGHQGALRVFKGARLQGPPREHPQIASVEPLVIPSETEAPTGRGGDAEDAEVADLPPYQSAYADPFEEPAASLHEPVAAAATDDDAAESGDVDGNRITDAVPAAADAKPKRRRRAAPTARKTAGPRRRTPRTSTKS